MIINFYCEYLFFEKIIKTHSHIIRYREHPKRCIDNLRITNKDVKYISERHLATLFFEYFSFEKKKELPELSLLWVQQLNCQQSIDPNIINFFKMERKSTNLNFWEIIIMGTIINNYGKTKACEHVNDFFIYSGCFKFFKLSHGIKRFSQKCDCLVESRLMLSRSKDGTLWFFKCFQCKFYETVASYRKQNYK